MVGTTQADPLPHRRSRRWRRGRRGRSTAAPRRPRRRRAPPARGGSRRSRRPAATPAAPKRAPGSRDERHAARGGRDEHVQRGRHGRGASVVRGQSCPWSIAAPASRVRVEPTAESSRHVGASSPRAGRSIDDVLGCEHGRRPQVARARRRPGGWRSGCRPRPAGTPCGRVPAVPASRGQRQRCRQAPPASRTRRRSIASSPGAGRGAARRRGAQARPPAAGARASVPWSDSPTGTSKSRRQRARWRRGCPTPGGVGIAGHAVQQRHLAGAGPARAAQRALDLAERRPCRWR